MRECSPPQMCHVSHVTCHVSCVTCHVSRVTCHMSRVTFFFILLLLLLFYLFIFFFFLTKWWSLSVEGLSSTGLPRLVSRKHVDIFCSPFMIKCGLTPTMVDIKILATACALWICKNVVMQPRSGFLWCCTEYDKCVVFSTVW